MFGNQVLGSGLGLRLAFQVSDSGLGFSFEIQGLGF